MCRNCLCVAFVVPNRLRVAQQVLEVLTRLHLHFMLQHVGVVVRELQRTEAADVLQVREADGKGLQVLAGSSSGGGTASSGCWPNRVRPSRPRPDGWPRSSSASRCGSSTRPAAAGLCWLHQLRSRSCSCSSRPRSTGFYNRGMGRFGQVALGFYGYMPKNSGQAANALVPFVERVDAFDEPKCQLRWGREWAGPCSTRACSSIRSGRTRKSPAMAGLFRCCGCGITSRRTRTWPARRSRARRRCTGSCCTAGRWCRRSCSAGCPASC